MTMIRRYKDSFSLFVISLLVMSFAGWLFGLVCGVVLSLCVCLAKALYDGTKKGGAWGMRELIGFILGLIVGVIAVYKIL